MAYRSNARLPRQAQLGLTMRSGVIIFRRFAMTPDASITLNCNAPQLRLARDLATTLEHALVSLHGVTALADLPPHLSTPWESGAVFQVVTREPALARTEAERWLFTNAFRDAIEHVAAFFEGLREANAILPFVAREPFSYDEFTAAVSGPAQVFDRRHFFQKIDELTAAGLMPAEDAPRLLSINRARNCLVHRRGVVGAQDLDPGTSTLRVTWERAEIVARAEDGTEREVHSTSPEIAKGECLFARIDPAERTFALGDVVHFGASDVSAIWMTLHSFGQRATVLLFEKARQSGIVFQAEPDLAAAATTAAT